MSERGVHRHLPRDLRDTDVVAVAVLPDFRVRVTHRDGTSVVHRFDPADFHGDFIELRDPATFATVQPIDGTLAWTSAVGSCTTAAATPCGCTRTGTATARTIWIVWSGDGAQPASASSINLSISLYGTSTR